MIGKKYHIGALAVLIGCLPLAPAVAQMAPTATAEAKPGVLEPEAIAALDRMGAYLRSLPPFRLVSTGTTEKVFANGQKLQFLQRTTYTVGGADKLRIKVETDAQGREVFYDGKTVSIVAPRAGKYITLPATGTVSEFLSKAYEDWGLEFPVQDLFRWGTKAATEERPTEGLRVGDARIGEARTDHFAFRQPGTDWQIWIDQGDKPLPRKLVITDLEDAARPQYVAYFTWDFAPDTSPGNFVFTPAATDTRIDINQFASAAK